MHTLSHLLIFKLSWLYGYYFLIFKVKSDVLHEIIHVHFFFTVWTIRFWYLCLDLVHSTLFHQIIFSTQLQTQPRFLRAMSSANLSSRLFESGHLNIVVRTGNILSHDISLSFEKQNQAIKILSRDMRSSAERLYFWIKYMKCKVERWRILAWVLEMKIERLRYQ